MGGLLAEDGNGNLGIFHGGEAHEDTVVRAAGGVLGSTGLGTDGDLAGPLGVVLVLGAADALFFRSSHEMSVASRTGKTVLAIVLQFIVTGACVMFVFMLTSLIRHSVLSMTTIVLLVFLFTPGYRVLVDLFELPSGVKQIWIIELLSTTSDLAFNRTDVLIMLVVGLLYAVISTSLGIHFFKVQKL